MQRNEHDVTNRYGIQTGDIFVARHDDDIICFQVMTICDSLNIIVQEVYPEITDTIRRDEITRSFKLDDSRKRLSPFKSSRYIKDNRKGMKIQTVLKGIYIPAIKYDGNNYALLYEGTLI
ncbi:hypothetical protein MKC73_01065 [[Clostridium] innocuum]|nr:hypothetical protein [[Clostridium] innocuum]